MTKTLFCRFGGIGDAFVMTAVAKEVMKRYPNTKIDFAVRSKEQVELLGNLDVFNKVYEIRRFPHEHHGMNCVKSKDGWESLENRKAKYDVVFDFVNSIENNSMNREIAGLYGPWMASQNSNYVNWYDLSFAWVNIDPETVSDKRPLYKVEESEKRSAKKLLSKFPRPIVSVNMFSSSRARTYFNVQPVISQIIERVKGVTVILRNPGDGWLVIRDGGSERLTDEVSARKSAAIIGETDCFLSADSGFSHIAEAMEVETVSIYTTVPAWTRNKYYKHSHDIDIQLVCKPCFTLDYQCPVNKKRAFDSLNEREKELLSLQQSNLPIHLAARQLNTTPDKLQQESMSINQKIDSLASVVPDCVASITPSMIVEKVIEALQTRGLNGVEKVEGRG
jgi:ADP-heptose:LPS heptosyltransferase